MSADAIYKEMVRHILNENSYKDDRTGTGTLSVVGYTTRYPLSSYRNENGDLIMKDFPLLTTKRVSFHNIVTELLWFINGQTNIYFLEKNSNSIWIDWPLKYYNQENPNNTMTRGEFHQAIKNDMEFAEDWGSLGPVYGKNWRQWDATGAYEEGFLEDLRVDQFSNMLNDVVNNPNSRRIIVNSWNAGEIPAMTKSGLPPCHYCYQIIVKDGKVNMILSIRSQDVMLGHPYNLAEYALLVGMIAEYANLDVGELVINMGDCHIYKNHIEAMEEQLSREEKSSPTVGIRKGFLAEFMSELIGNLDLDYSKYKDSIVLANYNPHAAIKAPVAV